MSRRADHQFPGAPGQCDVKVLPVLCCITVEVARIQDDRDIALETLKQKRTSHGFLWEESPEDALLFADALDGLQKAYIWCPFFGEALEVVEDTADLCLIGIELSPITSSVSVIWSDITPDPIRSRSTQKDGPRRRLTV